MNFRERLIQLRKSAGLSQEKLAEQLNLSRRAVSKWESAASTPDIDNIIQLAKLYGVSTDYILLGKTPEPVSSPPREDPGPVRSCLESPDISTEPERPHLKAHGVSAASEQPRPEASDVPSATKQPRLKAAEIFAGTSELRGFLWFGCIAAAILLLYCITNMM